MLVQALPSGEVWIWNDLPYAFSHCSTTWEMVAVVPRSTRSHCGSLHWLPQRVPGLLSNAPAAGDSPSSCEDARAGLLSESRVGAAASAEVSWIAPTTIDAMTAVVTPMGVRILLSRLVLGRVF